MADIEGLRTRIEAARKREQDARVAAARLGREMSALSRRMEAQRLCTLGRAWDAYADLNPQHVASMTQFIASYIRRPRDREVLATTRWALPEGVIDAGSEDQSSD